MVQCVRGKKEEAVWEEGELSKLKPGGWLPSIYPFGFSRIRKARSGDGNKVHVTSIDDKQRLNRRHFTCSSSTTDRFIFMEG